MSEYAYPDSEHVEGYIDYFTGNSEQLLAEQRQTLLHLSEKLQATEERDRRRDEAICLMEWTFSRFPAQHSATITPSDILSMLGHVDAYAARGKQSAWIAQAKGEVGR